MSKYPIPKNSLKVAVLQLNSNDNFENNWQQLNHQLNEIVKTHNDVDLICLPENALFLRVSLKEKLMAFKITDKKLKELNIWANEHQVHIHLGGVAIEKDSNVYNASVWLGDESPEVVYEKIHLFDIEINGQSLKESNDFSAGETPKTKIFKGWNIGLSICYDMRFSELYYYFAKNNVNLILVPAAFLQVTGEKHWHALLKARAIECQAFVVAAAQCGTHTSTVSGKSRNTYGHSLVIDPWGEVLSDNNQTQPSFKVVTLDPEILKVVRERIPMESHRVLD